VNARIWWKYFLAKLRVSGRHFMKKQRLRGRDVAESLAWLWKLHRSAARHQRQDAISALLKELAKVCFIKHEAENLIDMAH
jgi:hypothetical protein